MKRKRISAAVSLAALCCTVRLTQATATLTNLASFNGTGTGMNPFNGVVADSNGNFYGTTAYGGLYGDGTVFELSGTNHQTLTTLINFNGGNGQNPIGALMIDSSGNLYGTTKYGGANNDGTVFGISSASLTSLTTYISFNSSSGTLPSSGLTMDSSGNFYGTTTGGGANNDGIVYEIPGKFRNTLTVLTAFNGSNGSVPYGGITLDSAGNLYGTTAAGGSSGNGTVYQLSGTNHTTLTTLVSFNGTNGSLAEQGVIFGPDGNLYGTTAEGGTAGTGNVYRLSGTNFQTITNLISFTGANGMFPWAVLKADAAGNLFGTTQSGGTVNPGAGSVFELSGTNYQNYTQVYGFSGSLSSPLGALYNDSSGSLYGTANSGGNSSDGAVFQLSGSGFVTVLPPITIKPSVVYNVTPPPAIEPVVVFDSIALSASSQFNVNTHLGKQRTIVTEIHDVAFSNGSGVNLNNNDFDLATANGSSPQITIQGFPTYTDLGAATSAVAMAYNNGKWNGSTGFTSTTAANDTTHLTAVGVIQNNQSGNAIYSSFNPFDGAIPGPGDILLKYTYYGDANLDGVVDGSDYSVIDAGYLSNGALTGWFYGDFNFDGIIDGSDYTLIDNAFNNQGAAYTASTETIPTMQIASAVPEPGVIGAAVIAAPAILRRTRRRSMVSTK